MYRKNLLKVPVLLAALGCADVCVADRLRDPTQPLDNQSRSSGGSISIVRSNLTLNSILISPSRRIAVINGRSLGEGDFLDGVEITRIREDGVGIRRNGERYFLKPDVITRLVKQRS